MRAREVIAILKKHNGVLLRQRGSHQRWQITKDGISKATTIPVHPGDIPNGTLINIEKQLEDVLGKGWLKNE